MACDRKCIIRTKTCAVCIFCLLFVTAASGQKSYETLRKEMVRSQIQERGVDDHATLKAMRKVPRHLFVLDEFKYLAYSDSALPIGHQQTISQPYIVGFMTSQLHLKAKERVLEIGTGSGYQAAVLAEIVDSVYTIEIVEPLGLQATERLMELGYDNVEVRIGDGYHGWPEKAPFDAIIVTAAVEKIPQPLLDQLAEGGRLIIPVGPVPEFRVLQIVTKRKGKFKTRNTLPVRFVPFKRKKDKN
ncbi:MAG: protein-L-isoaspartate(D-aspartate) O-methyltransferase [Flavobacteriaceae bacterium]|nr:protein-L-isoaspartate(D-aspartate) O-methyltransferase [Flavobacteriaceae bacterium]NNL79910.1 protein-L-isoaspartate(D-aspartate) O-methyltransferase [Flavobacteriaceae bacterium]